VPEAARRTIAVAPERPRRPPTSADHETTGTSTPFRCLSTVLAPAGERGGCLSYFWLAITTRTVRSLALCPGALAYIAPGPARNTVAGLSKRGLPSSRSPASAGLQHPSKQETSSSSYSQHNADGEPSLLPPEPSLAHLEGGRGRSPCRWAGLGGRYGGGATSPVGGGEGGPP
jgi:hypothetical protein